MQIADSAATTLPTFPESRGPGPLLRAAVCTALTGIALLFGMIAAFALPVLVDGSTGGPFSWTWLPSSGHFGILPMLCGSLLLSLSALLLAWPLALGICCRLYLGEGRPGQRGLTALLRGLVRGMTAIPTVVYGFAALFLLTPLIREGLDQGAGLCWLSAALVLALLILPTMVLVMEAGLRPRLETLHLSAASLGLTRLQTLGFLALPSARRSLISAAVLGFGRAAGDTLVSLMLAGNAPQLPASLYESLRTLTAHMALVTANEVGGAAYNSLFAAGALLLVVNASISLLARRLSRAGPDARRASCARDTAGSSGRMRHGPKLSASGILTADILTGTLRLLSLIAPLLTAAGAGALLVFLFLRGLPALDVALFFGDTPPWQGLLGLRPVWDGIWPACAGTLSLVALTMALALFPGVGCGLFLAEYATPRQRRWIGCAADMLAGTPSIVMGLFGFTLILFLRRTLWPDANTCLLLAAACLALLVLPVLVVTTREALEALPLQLRLTTAALGLTPAQRLRHVLLPAARRGISGGVMLAVGRAAEDTAVIMLTGVVANAGLPAGLGGKFEALPFFIYYTAAQYQTQEELTRGFGAALLLLALSAASLLAARRIAPRLSR